MASKLVLLAIVACTFASPTKNNKAITINGLGRVSTLDDDHTKTLVTYYDCSGKADGNYVHPFDCTKFMSCVDQSYAYERNCADCHINEHNCPTGRLHYDHPQDSCLWAYEAGCVVDGGNQTTTPAPQTEPTTSRPEKPTTVRPVTDAPSIPTTGAPGSGSCNPDECWTDGYCHEYNFCERVESDHKGEGKDGFWVNATCGDNLYFNPNVNSIHGGVCDFWENLDDALKNQYNSDPNCIDPHCEWKADPTADCSPIHWYFHPEQNDGKDQQRICPKRADGEQLIWDQSRKSCHLCHTVKKAFSEEMCCVNER